MAGGFENLNALQTLIVSENIKTINSNAFNGCIGLSSVSLPGTLETIGEYAFNGCSSLTSISIPNASAIERYAFSGCIELSSVSLPETLETISEYAFYECSSLTSITIPANVSTIEKYAFYGTELTSCVISPDKQWSVQGCKIGSVVANVTLGITSSYEIDPDSTTAINVSSGRQIGIDFSDTTTIATVLKGDVTIDGWSCHFYMGDMICG